MKKTVQTVIAAALVAGSVGAAYAKGAADAKRAVFTNPDELKWTEMMPGGPSISVLWGDTKKGPFQLLMKFPAGFDSGLHTHSADYHAVVVKGTMVNSSEGVEPKTQPVGSYWLQPGKVPHANKCTADGECIVAIHQDKAFDFQPVKSDVAPAAAKK